MLKLSVSLSEKKKLVLSKGCKTKYVFTYNCLPVEIVV